LGMPSRPSRRTSTTAVGDGPPEQRRSSSDWAERCARAWWTRARPVVMCVATNVPQGGLRDIHRDGRATDVPFVHQPALLH
jgi:hypothetical protein